MHVAAKLTLVPIIDIFTMLLFFLMMNSGNVEVLDLDKTIKLPDSTAEKRAEETLLVKINADDIIVQGHKIASVADVMAANDDVIATLQNELDVWAARKLEVSAEEKERGHAVTIMGDQKIPYRLLKRVMTTCAQADFRDISLAVATLEESGAQPNNHGKPHGSSQRLLRRRERDRGPLECNMVVVRVPNPKLPWSSSYAEDSRFRRILLTLLAMYVVIALMVAFLRLPPVVHPEPKDLPPQLANVVLQKDELPKPWKRLSLLTQSQSRKTSRSRRKSGRAETQVGKAETGTAIAPVPPSTKASAVKGPEGGKEAPIELMRAGARESVEDPAYCNLRMISPICARASMCRR